MKRVVRSIAFCVFSLLFLGNLDGSCVGTARKRREERKRKHDMAKEFLKEFFGEEFLQGLKEVNKKEEKADKRTEIKKLLASKLKTDMNMKSEKIKKDFPIFANNSDLTYLDNAATSQKPQIVIDTIKDFYEHSYASVHRSLYQLAENSTQRFEDVREKARRFINAKHQEEIIFTKGTTEGLNFVAAAWAAEHLSAGDEIVTTQVEHHANLLPWQRVARQTGATLKFIPLDRQSFMLHNVLDQITEKTKLVSVTHTSNVLGNVWQPGDLKALIKKAHEVGAKVMLDCAQSIAHEKVDVQELDVDFIAFSSHKMYGPAGVGVLYIRKELHHDVDPYHVGGSMVHSVSFQSASWDQAPQKFEAGTPAITPIIGFGAALDYYEQNINFDELRHHESTLCGLVVDGLSKFQEVKIVGNIEMIKKEGHVVCFAIKRVHAHDIAELLGSRNIAVRAGHHCAQPLVGQLLGFDALLRVSVGAYNTVEDIEKFLEVFEDVLKFFKKL